MKGRWSGLSHVAQALQGHVAEALKLGGLGNAGPGLPAFKFTPDVVLYWHSLRLWAEITGAPQ
jgi:hypothetical protein